MVNSISRVPSDALDNYDVKDLRRVGRTGSRARKADFAPSPPTSMTYTTIIPHNVFLSVNPTTLCVCAGCALRRIVVCSITLRVEQRILLHEYTFASVLEIDVVRVEVSFRGDDHDLRCRWTESYNTRHTGRG